MVFKILLVCAVLVLGSSKCDNRRAVPFVPEVAEHILKVVKECTEEFKIDSETIALVKKGGYSADENFQKFVFCSYNRSGYADNDGNVDVDKTIAAFPKDAGVGDVVRKCSQSKGTDAVNTIYEYFKCFELNSPVRLALK